MRHKYSTEAVILSRTPHREAGILALLLTRDLGLVYARVEGVRRAGAKLAHALQSLSRSELTLVRGKEGWRVTGALLNANIHATLAPEERNRAARVSGLLQRMHGKEIPDERIFKEFLAFLEALTTNPDDGEALESLAVLRLLHFMGMDAGVLPPEGYVGEALAHVQTERKSIIERINKGISISGL